MKKIILLIIAIFAVQGTDFIYGDDVSSSVSDAALSCLTGIGKSWLISRGY
jgi:hypothetical protein